MGSDPQDRRRGDKIDYARVLGQEVVQLQVRVAYLELRSSRDEKGERRLLIGSRSSRSELYERFDRFGDRLDLLSNQ